MAMTAFYRLAVYFHHLAVGGEDWVHNSEAWSLTEGDIGPDENILTQLADNLILFYSTICLTTVFIEKVVVSTWIKDTRSDAETEPGYQAAESATNYYSVYGERAVAGSPESLDVVLDVRRTVSVGNPGRAPIRGVILRSDVSTNAQGTRGLLPGSPVAAGGAVWVDAVAHLADHFAGGSHPIKLAMLSANEATGEATPAHFRVVSGLVPVSARIIQLTKHK